MTIGDPLDDFTLPITGGGDPFTLSAARGKIVVLYFYPKDDTPGCTIEGNEFSAMLDEFDAAGAVVLGVSRDNLRSHERFRAKFDYRHQLLADTDAALCRQFDVLRQKTMYGKPVTGVSRSTFLIDGDGRLAHEWRDIKDAAGHAAEVLAKVRELGAG